MFCRKCGNVIPDDSVFCLKCGTKVEIAESKTDEKILEKDVFAKEENVLVEETITRDNEVSVDSEISSPNNMDTTDSKPKYGIWIAGIVIVVLFFIIVILTSANTCEMNSCSNGKQTGSDFCREHTCTVEGCNSCKSTYGNYCYSHRCTDFDCENKREERSDYCVLHTCSNAACNNHVEDNSSYCSNHQIDMNKRLGHEFGITVNSAGGINLDFRAKNTSGKEIKYIRFEVEFRNAVGDRIQDEITDDYTVNVEVVGPIANGRSANFYDIIAYNDNCTRIDISDITIIYTDGTSETGHYGWYTER